MLLNLLYVFRDLIGCSLSTASQASFSTHPTPAMLRPPIATVAFPMNGKLKNNQSPDLSQNRQGYIGTENFMVTKEMIY